MTITFTGELAYRPTSPVQWVEIDPSANPTDAMDLFIAFNPATRSCWLEQRHQSERGSVPLSVYRNLVWWFALESGANARLAWDILTQDCAEDLEIAANGYSVEQDQGRVNDRASDAIDRITERLLAAPTIDEGGLYDAAAWLDGDCDMVTSNTTDDELEQIAARVDEDARDDDCILYGTLDAVTSIRDYLRELAEDTGPRN